MAGRQQPGSRGAAREVPMHGRQQPRLPKASDVLADRLRGQLLGNQMQPGEPLRPEPR